MRRLLSASVDFIKECNEILLAIVLPFSMT